MVYEKVRNKHKLAIKRTNKILEKSFDELNVFKSQLRNKANELNVKVFRNIHCI